MALASSKQTKFPRDLGKTKKIFFEDNKNLFGGESSCRGNIYESSKVSVKELPIGIYAL